MIGSQSSMGTRRQWGTPHCRISGSRLIELFWFPGFEPSRVFFVDADELDQVFDSEVCECLDSKFSDAMDPDDAVLELHLTRDVSQPVFVFAEVLGDTGDDFDVMDLVDVYSMPLVRRAPRAEVLQRALTDIVRAPLWIAILVARMVLTGQRSGIAGA